MLRSFRVANHRSIRAEQELLLIPAYDKQRPVLPVAAIYGANASGKSNLLDALRFMQAAVRSSYAEWEPGAGVPRRPFLLDPAARAEPSVFVVDLLLAGVRHTYGFEIDDERVREEWLYAYPERRRRVIFEREGDDVRFGSTHQGRRASGALLADLTRPNALLLTVAARTNLSAVMPAYDWFRDGIASLAAPHAPSPPGTGLWQLVTRLEAAEATREAVLDLIRTADLGVVDVAVEADPDDGAESTIGGSLVRASATNAIVGAELDALRGIERSGFAQSPATKELHSLRRRELLGDRSHHGGPRLSFVQGQHGLSLELQDQSDGTRSWLELIGVALAALESGALLLVDEIDSSLHPRLTARLVELFQDERTNPRSAQLVFTTHDAALLGAHLGVEVLQRDQVWFVEKDDVGRTALFPLTDFHPRKNENTERRYLGGSYGAVPAVFTGSLVDAYLGEGGEPSDGQT
ncbi:MAG: AAA family ATPase [Actinobacteria bacterium]|nr:AAA family ATPase [Actinomycetota bacterium]